nr:Tripartite terminase [Ipomoea batatas]
MSDTQSELLLPAEILDGDLRMDPFAFGSKTKPDPPSLCFPAKFPYHVFSSPAEIESDEDDFLAGLTRRLTRVSLDRAYNYTSAHRHTENGSLLSGSPESMLNRVHSMSGRSGGSGNGPSMASSPSTTTRLEAKHNDWNLIFQAAGQVAKLKMNTGDGAFRNQCLPGAPRNISSVYPVNVPQSAMPDVHFREARGDQQEYIMWNRQKLLQNRRNRVGLESGPFMESERRRGQLLGWPSQQFSRSNMKTAFSGAGAGKRECAGTGVFLPRRYGGYNGNTPTDSRKKTACPVALHTGMNKKPVDSTGLVQPQPPYITDGFAYADIMISRRRAAMLSQQVKNLRPDGGINHEPQLPLEWTY